MIGRLRAACRTNSAQVESVVAMSAMNGLACVGATSWPIVAAALLFWPAVAFLGNLLHPIPE